MKIFKRRDSATAYLRKLKVAKANYDKWLKPITASTGEGHWGVLDPKKPEPEVAAKDVEASVKAAKAMPPAKPVRISCSSVARDLIRAGKTNTEVWVAIKEQFKLSDDKRHYPTWYRSQMKRSAKRKAS